MTKFTSTTLMVVTLVTVILSFLPASPVHANASCWCPDPGFICCPPCTKVTGVVQEIGPNQYAINVNQSGDLAAVPLGTYQVANDGVDLSEYVGKQIQVEAHQGLILHMVEHDTK